jgi:hypothetical protein
MLGKPRPIIGSGKGVNARLILLMLAIAGVSGANAQTADTQTKSALPLSGSLPAIAASPNRQPQSRKARRVQTARRPPSDQPNATHSSPADSGSPWDEITLLKEHLARQEALLVAQQQQIERLSAALEEHGRILERSLAKDQSKPSAGPVLGEYASLRPVLAASAFTTPSPAGEVSPARSLRAESVPVTQNEFQGYTAKVDQLGKSLDGALKGLAGFKFSGDFRLRLDSTLRSSNRVAGPVQNVRGNYRLRFNLDKALNDQLAFHFQVGSGQTGNALTYNSDFGGIGARGPIFIGEAWANYRPNQHLSVRGGKIPEVLADDSRFLFKEDIRFNGFQEIVRIPFESNPLGITAIEFKAGQYILTNPNVTIVPALPSSSSTTAAAATAYIPAGYSVGGKVRDTNLFHQGFVVSGKLGAGWRHDLTADVQLFRNPNQIALAATPVGAAVVVAPYYNVPLASPIPGTGTATTTPGGAAFTASHFQIAHLDYRLTYDGPKLMGREMPLNIEAQAARNVGASFLRNAFMGIVCLGEVRKRGDLRLLYGYAVKDANSLISELTDDYLGTTTGVNIRTHEVRVDVGLTPFLAWQNLLFIQNPLSGSDPARHFYVPIQPGAATQYRVQTQLQFKF